MKLTSLVSLVALAAVLPGHADYVVDVDLGVLPLGDTMIAGTTALVEVDPGPPPITTGGNNNSLFVKNIVVSNLTWGNEIVYQFTLAQPSLVSLIKESDFPGNDDPDFFLLRGLTTSVDAETGKISADEGLGAAFLDGAAPETAELGALREGTYYLSVENFDDNSFGIINSTFSVTISVLESLPSELVVDLGHIGVADEPLTFDTFGSNYNTELAIYDFFETLLFENDDAAGGQQSEISIPQGLPAGSYYAVLAGNDVTFDPFLLEVPTGGAVGDYVFNFPLGDNLEPGLEIGTTSAGTEARETQRFLFTISTSPADAVDLGTLANANEPFEINTLGSGFDTQLAVFDAPGFLLFFNDDSAGGFQSTIDFTEGLAEGTWFAALAGYPTFFGDGFVVIVDTNVSATSAGGGYELSHPLGVESGAVNTNEHVWFQFEIAPAIVLPSIDITSLAFNSATNEFTIAWDTSLPGPFNIRIGTAAELEALQSAPNNLLPTTAGAGIASSPITIPVPAALQGEDQLFLQVTD